MWLPFIYLRSAAAIAAMSSPIKTARIFLFCAAMLWSVSLAIWFASGFGYAPLVSFGAKESFAWGVICTSPLWLSSLSLASTSMVPTLVRLISLVALTAFFAVLGPFVAKTVVFYGINTSKPVAILMANMLLFRLPFVLAFIATLLLAKFVWQDLRRWRQSEVQSP